MHRVADRMVDEAQRVSRTIDDLLELSRIELGEEPVRDIVDVGDVVEAPSTGRARWPSSAAIDIDVLERAGRRRACAATAASSSRRSATSSRTP